MISWNPLRRFHDVPVFGLVWPVLSPNGLARQVGSGTQDWRAWLLSQLGLWLDTVAHY